MNTNFLGNPIDLSAGGELSNTSQLIGGHVFSQVFISSLNDMLLGLALGGTVNIPTGPFGPLPPRTSGPVPTASSGSSGGAGSSPDAIMSLLLSIPRAYEGQIITSDHHNNMLAALIALAARMGIQPGMQAGTLTYPPFFTKHEQSPEWPTVSGVAIVESGDAWGWLPVNLPHGSHIQGLAVRGRRSGAINGPFEVTLIRVAMADGGKMPLINVALQGASDPFLVEGTVLAPGASAMIDALTVDATKYTYVVLARVTKVQEDATAQINAIQIAYS